MVYRWQCCTNKGCLTFTNPRFYLPFDFQSNISLPNETSGKQLDFIFSNAVKQIVTMSENDLKPFDVLVVDYLAMHV